jgi:ATP/maltotriose-dependent transcriptional regulator MalT
VGELVNAWTSVVQKDFDRALREAAGSVERLRGQDEPLWTAVAVLSLGGLEAGVGRYDDAERHLTETRELGERFDNDWLAAASRIQLGQLALARGALDARALFRDALKIARRAPTTTTSSCA